MRVKQTILLPGPSLYLGTRLHVCVKVCKNVYLIGHSPLGLFRTNGNNNKAAWAFQKAKFTGLAISRPSWDFLKPEVI